MGLKDRVLDRGIGLGDRVFDKELSQPWSMPTNNVVHNWNRTTEIVQKERQTQKNGG
jgi:hypothetical protein